MALIVTSHEYLIKKVSEPIEQYRSSLNFEREWKNR